MSQPSPTAKTESAISRLITATHLFWAAIIIVILGVSLFAALIAEGWFVTTPPEPHSESTQAIQSASDESIPKTTGWKTMAQQIQHAEDKTLQVLANALEKLPDLAPLPRPNVPSVIPPALVKTAPSSPIAWKLLSEQLAVTEQQQVMMLQNFLAKAEK